MSASDLICHVVAGVLKLAKLQMHAQHLFVLLDVLHTTLLEAAALPSVFILGKEPFALGKVRSAKFFSAKGLCRVIFIRALGKIFFLPSAWGGTRQNIFVRCGAGC